MSSVLCEATCGLEVASTAGVFSISAGTSATSSQGYLCPKGASLAALHEDPDRLTTPLVKRNGVFYEATWDQASPGD
jgi:anaerobic selenocysteine-containing dehydrogenase